MKSERFLLVGSRFLTRVGDTSWSFALPLALIALFPGDLRPVVLSSLTSKLLVILLSGRLGSWVDTTGRMSAVSTGIVMQLLGIAGVLGYFLTLPTGELTFSFLTILPILLGGIAATLGASLVDIALTSDWIPTAFERSELSQANGALQRAVLLAEIFGPLASGALVSVSPDPRMIFSGFATIAFLNDLSFFVEYSILSILYKQVPALRQNKPATTRERRPLYSPLHALKLVREQSVGSVTLAMMFLYFTVLSPHGALLTAYMKSEWHLSESTLGFVRGAGALAGVFSAWCYQYLSSRRGIVYAATSGITSQALCVTTACIALYTLPSLGFIIFFVMLVLSRLGLYTFEVAEMQLRQEHISPDIRGSVAGAAWNLNYSAMILLDVIAYFFHEPWHFPILMVMSCVSVLIGTALVRGWARSELPETR